MQQEKKELGGWWVWVTILFVGSIIVFSLLSSLGFIGKTVVERVVFEQSFQYKEGMDQRARILEANIAELDAMIGLGQGNAAQLQAQKRVLTIQLKATKR